jgi:hypothetical protein
MRGQVSHHLHLYIFRLGSAVKKKKKKKKKMMMMMMMMMMMSWNTNEELARPHLGA